MAKDSENANQPDKPEFDRVTFEIPAPMNRKLIDALFLVTTRLQEIRIDMDKLIVSNRESDDKESKDKAEENLVSDINSLPPSELSWGDLDIPEDFAISSWLDVGYGCDQELK